MDSSQHQQHNMHTSDNSQGFHEHAVESQNRADTCPQISILGAQQVQVNPAFATSSYTEDIPPPKPDYYAPPPYEVATKGTKLPTYEEVQREKHLEGQDISIPINSPSQRPIPTFIQPGPGPGPRVLTIDSENSEDVDTSLLGTDFMFYIAFFVAFIFNWIGFLLLMCFCHTIASRYGALSGFGLSLAKWTFIVQHSTELASKDNSWLWWLIMTFVVPNVPIFQHFWA
ncbi:unnamed protein product [Acanthoscelides obtectus]|uniref:NEDD4 family-interacting protein 1-like n=1 Tax=Acanthoscelides obtectus TaxID=200917 RepID=A0A9P0JL25_ACAOB|nr:unnamed protein product [Acanthoscelides obtectus]CAK1672973.1 NEDD4 family-interacting protein 1 [Acanthoscelides obtectus]